MNVNEIPRIETHAHSHYSNIRLLDCINRPKDMLLRCAELGLKGLALTDHEALGAHMEWLQLEKDLKEKGKLPEDFKAILGNEIYLTKTRDKGQKYFHFILIAKDTLGHKALRELSSTAWYNSYYDRRMERVPTLKSELEEIVQRYKGHLVGLTACLGSETAQLVLKLAAAEDKSAPIEEINSIKREIADFLAWGKRLFEDDFYIEVAPSLSKDQITYNTRVKKIAAALHIPMIVGCDAHYLKKEDRFIHEAYLNSKDGEREIASFYEYSHFMDNKEAYSNLIPYFSDEEFEEMCRNSMDIYNKIGTYDLFHNPIIPEVEVKVYDKFKFDSEYKFIAQLTESDNIQERYWINECLRGLDNLRPWTLWDSNKETYLKRIDLEADIILTIGGKLGNCLFQYFNTFQHFIDLFWECGSLSGPGRGSSVCYLSNYLLGITQLDPIYYQLPEWRFLNKERIELPDIDTDLSPSRRKLIFKKMREERGELNVVQVSTYGREQSRRAILTACRGYRSPEYPKGIDVDIGQYLTSLIPQERGFLWSIEEVVYGDEEKGREPVKAFLTEVNKYPGLLQIIESIQSLVSSRGQHASGVILYNDGPTNTGAIMRSPNGDLITQYDLHWAEAAGDTKIDMLVTEVSDKLVNAINLLKADGYFSDCNSLREIYEKNFHPSKINLKDEKIWNALASGDIIDVFQFNSNVGLMAAKAIKPTNPIDMTLANALMRLMGEKDKERPLDRYCRLKNDISQWYDEIRPFNFTDEEVKVLEKYYLPRHGVPATQEDLMMVCLEPGIANFTLKDANGARKIVAKKKMNEIEGLKKKFIESCKNHKLGEYVWETTMGPQMGYSFSLPHSLAYSFVGIQTLILATNYPLVYWNCACLITNSGGDKEDDSTSEEKTDLDGEEETIELDIPDGTRVADILEVVNEDSDDDANEEDVPETPVKAKKKKVKTSNYGKVATAIGQMQMMGISVSPPDINKSSYTFTPDAENNTILYGIKGISRIGDDLVKHIIDARPYSSLEDFRLKVPVTKPQMVNLIKSGIFNSLGDRTEIMDRYITSIAELKKRLTLQNMAMLIEKALLPEELNHEIKVYNFNKFIKKAKNGISYELTGYSLEFYQKHFDVDLLAFINKEDGSVAALLPQLKWDKIYTKAMDPVRAYLKKNLDSLLLSLNNSLLSEVKEKYCAGTLSKWEMDSVSFYYSEHELAGIDENTYEIENFFELPETPQVERVLSFGGKKIPLYRLSKIAGTVLDKNKNKSQVTLLTCYGVVQVKIYGQTYAKYDKQLSKKLDTGKKKVIEKSFFARGNKLIFTGVRNGDTFLAKKYKSSDTYLIAQITQINNDGSIEFRTKRADEISED